MVYHGRRTRSRSREPNAEGQHVNVFRPLPSIHQQQRQQFQTGVRQEFGVNHANNAAQQYRTPARERCKSHVNTVDRVDLMAATLAAPPPPRSPAKRSVMTERILKDHRRHNDPGISPRKRGRSVIADNEDIPEKRGRGRPRKEQNIPPPTNHSSRRSEQTPPPSNHSNSHNVRSDQTQHSDRPVGPFLHYTDTPVTRARSRAVSRGPDYNTPPPPRGRSRQPNYDAPTRGRSRVPEESSRRSARSSERQQQTTAPRYERPRQTRRSVDPVQQQQQPSSSNGRRSNAHATAPPPPPEQPGSRSCEMRDSCVALMVIRLYGPAVRALNPTAHFAPNVFARPAIEQNVNGGNSVGKIVDAVRRNEERR